MKSTGALVSLFLTVSIATIPKCHCQEIENPSMVYAVGGEIFVRKSGVSKKLTTFSRDVTGFAKYKDHLYVSVKRSESGTRDSGIWRVKVLGNNSTIFDNIKDSDWEEFDVINSDDAEILNMVIAKGYIYSGRSDSVIWRCSADVPHKCQNFNIFPLTMRRKGIVSNIVYKQNNYRVFAIESLRNPYSGSWYHKLWQCSSSTPELCVRVNFELKGWTTLYAAFDALWLADGGVVRKCRNKVCYLFHNFHKPVYVNIGASSKYLYARLENSNQIWRCDPDTANSCSKSFVVRDHDSNIGPFIIL